MVQGTVPRKGCTRPELQSPCCLDVDRFPGEHMYLKLLFVPIWNGFQLQRLQQMVLCMDGKRQPEQDSCSLSWDLKRTLDTEDPLLDSPEQ